MGIVGRSQNNYLESNEGESFKEEVGNMEEI